MNPGLRFLSLLIVALGTPTVATSIEQACPRSWGWIVSTLVLAAVYITLGALSWGGETSRSLSAFFLIGISAVLGTAIDIALNPTFRGYERNLWPLEIGFMVIVIWIPLSIGFLTRRLVRPRPAS